MRNRWMIVGVAVLVVGLATWDSGWSGSQGHRSMVAERAVVGMSASELEGSVAFY